MYEAHPEIITPEDNTVVWRFMSLEKFLSLITSSQLFFCRSDKFKDPWEGIWPKPVISSITQNWPVNDNVRFKELTLNLKTSFFINCWHENHYESAALWELYGVNVGIAIKSTVNRLKYAIKGSKHFFIGRMNYIDYYLENNFNLNMLIPIF